MIVERSTGEFSKKRLNVLIADDEEPVRHVLVTFLSKLGYQTTAVRNGMEALHQVQEGGVDLVISDYSMPLLNGVEFYQKMVEGSPELAKKFILITGTSFTHEVSSFVQCHQTLFLEKPFRLPDLASMVEGAIGPPDAVPAAVS